jgi:RNA polymerase sigma-70 factor (ECF subfamily)
MSSSFPTARFPALPLGREKAPKAASLHEDPGVVSSGEFTDDALIARICEEDQEALGLLFRRYCRLVWSVGQRILRNKEEADDLLQNVFLSVGRRAASFDPSKGTVRSFLVHITYQRAISHRRYLCCRQFYRTPELEGETEDRILALDRPGYDESLEAHFGRERLERAFAELSEEQRETLRLHFFEGYSLEEIAAHTGESFGNIRHYYYRGLDKLRRGLLTPDDSM